jgi:UPF0755 protein
VSETPPRKPGRIKQEWAKQRRRWSIGLGIGALCLSALVALGIAPLFRPLSTEHKQVRVTVPGRAGVTAISELLEEKQVIRSAFAFRLYARWNRAGQRFRAGRYTLYSDMTLAQIMQTLQRGPGQNVPEGIRVTIPEGYTLRQIGALLENKGICDREDFLKQATDPMRIRRIKTDVALPNSSVEGYLFPDTYYFEERTPPEKVIEKMVLNFSLRFLHPYQQEIARSGQSLHQILTKASLIEREARIPEDRARIAGVIENRLKRNMRLEIDATVLYALGYHKNRVLYADLKTDSPYNTYRNKGLPPGPIASPGLACLEAALRPEKHDYLFYVARPQGSHLFTRTLAEHDQACALVRKERQAAGAR